MSSGSGVSPSPHQFQRPSPTSQSNTSADPRPHPTPHTHARPDMPRPYRTLGYPVVPIAFVIAIACLVASTLVKSPRESLMGLALIALGLPFYYYWRSNSQTPPPESTH